MGVAILACLRGAREDVVPVAPRPARQHWSQSLANGAAVKFSEIEPAANVKMYKGKPLRTESTWAALDPEQARRLRGRPSSYREEYSYLVRDAMAEGYSLSGFAGKMGLSRSCLDGWQEKYPEFAESCARGKTARLYWWERQALEVAQTGGQGSQATMIIFGLKNMGSDDWRERIDMNHSGSINLSALVSDSMKTIEHEPVLIEQDGRD